MSCSGYPRLVLLRFGLENHTSFRDAAELSFVSTALADEPSWTMQARQAPHGVLPILGVWGANASGKSNLLGALKSLREHVRLAFGRGPDELIPWQPFAMRRGPKHPSTRMDIDVVVDDVRYHYGLRLRDSGFVEEWLYAWPKNRRQVLFHRDHREQDPWYFGPHLGGQRQQIARSTRSNSLFLSAAARYNHEQLTPLYTALTQGIRAELEIEIDGHPVFRPGALVIEPWLKPAVLAFLAAADLGVVDLRSTEHLAYPGSLPGHEESFELRLRHGVGGDRTSWELEPQHESRGTQILLCRLEDFLTALRDGALLILDEIDTSLHSDLCVELLRLFSDPEINRHRAQLLFTTHDRGLLEALRRDQIVLVDKARDGASTLRCASDYAGLRARDDLRRAHELGRIGGIPAVGDLAGAVARGLRSVP